MAGIVSANNEDIGYIADGSRRDYLYNQGEIVLVGGRLSTSGTMLERTHSGIGEILRDYIQVYPNYGSRYHLNKK